jgi:hypothetical protein
MMTPTTPATLDFDLHQIVGIRVLNASPADAAAVRRQLGPLERPLSREPDIVVRFVERLPPPRSLCYLGLDEAGFTEDAFWILRSKHKSQARVMIPVDQIGDRCEIVCETGLAAVPLLIAIINMTALCRGAVPLHASAFMYQVTGTLATGWSKGGKTETLLAFMAHGAQYIADEWVYLHSDGRMSGIPEPIRVWDWHLRDMPQYRPRASRSALTRLRAIHWGQAALGWVPGGSWPPGQWKNRLKPLLKRQAFVDVAAEKLFGRERMQLIGELHKLLFVVSHAASDIRVEPIDADEIARRMVHSLQYEQLGFMGYYRMFRFAFPHRINARIEQKEAMQTDLLRKALAGKDAYAVYHPYPVSLTALYEAIAPLCTGDPSSSCSSKSVAAAAAGAAR